MTQKHEWYYWKCVEMIELVSILYWQYVWRIVSMSHCVAKTCEHGKSKRDLVAFCSTGILLGCVSILVFVSNFDILCVVGGARLAFCNLRWLHAVVVLARARSDHLPSVVGFSARANVVTCAVKTHSFVFFVDCCLVNPIRDHSQLPP